MVALFQSILMTFLVSSFPGSLEKAIEKGFLSCKEMYSGLGYPKHIGEKHDSSSSSSSSQKIRIKGTVTLLNLKSGCPSSQGCDPLVESRRPC